MRFLIDADLPRDVVAILASYGHVAIDVRDIGMRSADDSEIAAYALQNGLCIITFLIRYIRIRCSLLILMQRLLLEQRLPGVITLTAVTGHNTNPLP